MTYCPSICPPVNASAIPLTPSPAVAGVESVRAVAESIERIVVPAAMPAPVTVCPTARPTVEERLVTAALAIVVTPVTPLVNVRAWEPAAVAAAERVTL